MEAKGTPSIARDTDVQTSGVDVGASTKKKRKWAASSPRGDSVRDDATDQEEDSRARDSVTSPCRCVAVATPLLQLAKRYRANSCGVIAHASTAYAGGGAEAHLVLVAELRAENAAQRETLAKMRRGAQVLFANVTENKQVLEGSIKGLVDRLRRAEQDHAKELEVGTVWHTV